MTNVANLANLANLENASRLRIGITIGLHRADETIWNNGIKQNAIFLADALARCASVYSVALLNTTPVPLGDTLPWSLTRFPTLPFEAAKDDIDLLIELGGQIDADQTGYLKARGVRLVSYCCGSEYLLAAQAMLFDRPAWGAGLFVNQRYDAIWMVPQVADANRPFFEVLRRQRAHAVPFVWSPVFLEACASAQPCGGAYAPHTEPRRLSVMEPNVDIVKFCLYPILIAELAYRERPGAIALLQVTNAQRLAEHSPDFVALMHQLDIVRERKATFLPRYDTPTFLAEYTDVVISHQMANPLNYFYLEVCWQGYALIHNAGLCSDLGYYYQGNDLGAGARRLVEALDRHDAGLAAYRFAQRQQIRRYLPENTEVVRTYEALLGEVMAGPIR